MDVFRTQLKAFDPGAPEMCDVCQAEFSLISVHNKIVHSGLPENKCAFCGMRFTNRKRLLNHLDVHSDGSDLFCCLCLRRQESDDALSEHLETHRELHVFLCAKCRRTFASKSGLCGHDCLPQVLDGEDEDLRPTVLTGSVVSVDKTDEENGVHVLQDESGPSENCGTPTLPLRSSIPVGESGAVKVAVKDHVFVNIGYRQLRLTESTFSDNLAPRASSETSIDPLRGSNRDGDVHQLSESTANWEENVDYDGLIETGVKLEANDLVGVVDVDNKVVAVKLEIEGNQIPENDSVNVDIQNPVVVNCLGAGQNGEFDVVSAGSASLAEHVTKAVLPDTPPDSGGSVLPQTYAAGEALPNGSLDAPASLSDSGGSVLPGTDAACAALPNGSLLSAPACLSDSGGSVLPGTDAACAALPNGSLDAPACLADSGGDFSFAQSPSTAVNVGTENPCTCDAELPQPAALPPDLKSEKGIEILPEESHTDPWTPIRIKAEETVTELESGPPTRKRTYAAAIGGDEVSCYVDILLKEEVVLDSEAQAELGGTNGTPDSPAPTKKKRISFNEQIEFWNPTLEERGWLDITEEFPEVREVPLLETSKYKRVSRTRKKRKGSKSAKILEKSNATFEEEGSLMSVVLSEGPEKPDDSSNTEVVCSTILSSPPSQKLRPVLKPSPQVAPDPKAKKTRGGRLPKNSKELFKLFGPNFGYKKCLKVDGRFHCPDNDCCDNKDLGFATDKGLRHHIRQNHLQGIIFHQCPKCDKTFPGRCKLIQHMETHNAPDAHSCPVCDKKFKSVSLVKQHRQIHEMVFQCYHCELKFSRKVSLVDHVRTSLCKCCNVVLRCAELFRRHELEVPHYYVCTCCNKYLMTLQRFNWHVRNFHYDRSTALDGTWICHICDRKFTSRHIALRHARVKHTSGPEMDPEKFDKNTV